MTSQYRKPGLFRISLESQTPKYADTTAVAIEQREHQHAFEVALERYEAVREACVSLEAIHTTLSQECDAGLSAQSAYYMTLAVDRLSAVGGFSQAATPAMESFQGSNARTSTVLSMEGVGERLKQMLEFLAKLWKQLVEAMKRAAQGTLAGIANLKSRAEKLLEAVRAHGVSSDMVSIDFADHISINGKVLPGIEGLKRTLVVAEEVDNYGIENHEGIAVLQSTIEKLKSVKTDEQFETALADLSKFKEVPPRCFKHREAGSDGGMTYSTDVIAGETSFVAVQDKPSSRDDADSLGRAVYSLPSITFHSIVKRSQHPSSAKVQPLTVEEIETIQASLKALEKLRSVSSKGIYEGNFEHDLSELLRAGGFDGLSPRNQSHFSMILHASKDQLKQRASLQAWILGACVQAARHYVMLGEASLAKQASQAT